MGSIFICFDYFYYLNLDITIVFTNKNRPGKKIPSAEKEENVFYL